MSEPIELAGCVIADERDRILLIHRADYKQWEIPGGKLESGESAEQAAIREADEELGVRVALHGLLAVSEFMYGKQLFQQKLFMASIILGTPRPLEVGKHDMITYQDVAHADSCNGSRFSAGYTALCEQIHSGAVNLHRNKNTT